MSGASVVAIDVGTQAARCLIVGLDGGVLAAGSAPIRSLPSELPDGWAEQDPEAWWEATCVACRAAVRAFGGDLTGLIAIAVDSTSGTIVPVDAQGRPLRAALMYNDVRAVAEARLVQEAGEEVADKLGYAFQASFALPKLLWLRGHEPDVFARAAHFLHATDFIVGRLSGGAVVSDTSNALKTGYDLVDRCWPAFIADFGIPLALLPRVVTPGEPVAEVSREAAEATGLPAGGSIVAGCTDGTAAFLASGASRPGDVNSNLGTTLVVRAVSESLVRDPSGRIYCHLHPDGWWLPGGASSSGGEIILRTFGERAQALEREVRLGRLKPVLLAYPLARTGERLPFVDPEARGFLVGEPASEAEHLAALMEGVAFVERWVFEVLEDLGAGKIERVTVTGGGAKSETWLRIRAGVLGLPLHRPAVAESALGAAILAASAHHGSVSAATAAMVRPDITIAPEAALTAAYEERYPLFRAACAERGYG